MSRKLDFTPLEEPADEGRGYHPAPQKRWQSREPVRTVQMSIRMPEETYERFRELCKQERRTNGDMLRVLMEGHFARGSK